MTITNLYDLYSAHPYVTTDSRNCPPDSLFFALRGDNFDGNRFAEHALHAGCFRAIVDDPAVVPAGDERYILVDNALAAYQQLAHHHRMQFRGPVLEITGTNGKTTTKELTAAVLSRRYHVMATEGNLNNHIGVPRTLLRLNAGYDFAIVETGANHPGEIAALADIVTPDFGLITNIGKAHLEGFGSFEGVKRTKGELYDHLRRREPSGRIFLHADNPHLCEMSAGLSAVGYGRPGTPGLFVEGEAIESAPFLRLRWRPCTPNAQWYEVQTHLVGAYNLDNALAAACVGTYFGVMPEDISTALESYTPQNSRSEMRVTRRNRLVVDAYNANPTSMAAAISAFTMMKADCRMAIIGEMRELGADAPAEHRRIVEMLNQAGFDEVWLVGHEFQAVESPFRTFADVEEVENELKNHAVKGRLILIKGSNSTRLYRLPELL